MLIPIGFFGAGGAAGAYELISTAVLSSGSTSVSFSSIPNTYKHLQLRYTARTDIDTSSITSGSFIFNSDSGANYSRHRIFGNGSTVASDGNVSISNVGEIYAAGNTSGANIFASGIVDILDYASTNKNKTIRLIGGGIAANSTITLRSGAWYSLSAISSITATISDFNFLTGSRFSLYGIKG